MVPVLLPDTYKPIRIFSLPNEIIMMDGEASTLWAHVKPKEYPHEQFTLELATLTPVIICLGGGELVQLCMSRGADHAKLPLGVEPNESSSWRAAWRPNSQTATNDPASSRYVDGVQEIWGRCAGSSDLPLVVVLDPVVPAISGL